MKCKKNRKKVFVNFIGSIKIQKYDKIKKIFYFAVSCLRMSPYEIRPLLNLKRKLLNGIENNNNFI